MELELEPLEKKSDKTDKPAVEELRYEGPERRVAQRRSGHDRRTAVRYEPDKADRRRRQERRVDNSPWDKGHTMF